RCRPHDATRLPVLVVEVPRVQPDQWDLIDERIGDLAQRSVRAADRDDGLAGERDDRVARVADAGEDGELNVRVWRGFGCVSPRQDPYCVSAGRARPPPERLHHSASPAADQGDVALPQLPPYLLSQPHRFGSRPFATDHGNYHGSHYSSRAV